MTGSFVSEKRNMTHIYKVSGMTCTGCLAKVQELLAGITGVEKVKINLATGEATIDMNKHITIEELRLALKDNPKYQIKEAYQQYREVIPTHDEKVKPWVVIYKPILLIFLYLTLMAIIAATRHHNFDWMHGMNAFMAGFFLTFSFFKMLDLKGFAESYAMYDIVAKKVKVWGVVYAFVELALGLAYATSFQPLLTNIATLAVMSVSIVGVLKSVFNKRKIQCACLGAVFNLPMSTVTIIEDALMISMSAGMIIAIA
jgi:cation transport ATPase